MSINVDGGEKFAVAATIDPQTVNSTPQVSDYIDMSLFHQATFIFALGDMASETIDARVQEATDSSGTGAKALKSATQLAAHATNNDNKQIVITVRQEDLDRDNDFTHVAGRLVTGNTTGGPACCIGIGHDPVYGPASDDDLATVVEIERDAD